MKKTILACAVVLGATIAIAATATYNATFNDAIVTGEGSIPGNLGEYGFGPNQNAALQVSRNNDAGQGQGAAIDAYASLGTNAYVQRWWVDCATCDGGTEVATAVLSNGSISTVSYILISGLVNSYFNRAIDHMPLSPTTDQFMLGIGADEANGAAIIASVCPSNLCSPTGVAAQAFIAMDGTSGVGNANDRFAISGQDGTHRWTASTCNNYGSCTWDTDMERVAAGILGSGGTSLQTPHLDQPGGKHDLAGSIAIAAANSGTFTFAVAYAGAPVCVLSPISNPAALTWWVTSTATTVTAHLSAASTITFNYHCVGNPN